MTSQTDLLRWKPRFFAIWSGQACSLLGSELVSFALIWWLTLRTGSETVLATAALVTLLPSVVLGPLAGTLVDRWSRRWVMVLADGLIALLTGSLAFLFWRGIAQHWHLYVVMFLRALGGAFHGPAMMASVSLMVPHEQLTRVGGMNQTLRGLLRIVAPPLGAVLLGVLPMEGVLAIDIGTAAIAIAPLLFLAVPQPHRRADGQRLSLFGDVWAGIRYIWAWRPLFWIVATCGLTDFFLGPARAFLPLLVTRELGRGALELGSITSASGVGIMVGGFLMTLWGGFRRRIVTSLVGWAWIGIACVALGLAPTYAWALAAAALLGLVIPLAEAPLTAFYQTCVEPGQQGRFFAVLGAINSAMMPLGLVVAGALGPLVGVRAWRVLLGVAHLLLALVWVLAPSILHAEDRLPGAGRSPQPAASGVPGA